MTTTNKSDENLKPKPVKDALLFAVLICSRQSKTNWQLSL